MTQTHKSTLGKQFCSQNSSARSLNSQAMVLHWSCCNHVPVNDAYTYPWDTVLKRPFCFSIRRTMDKLNSLAMQGKRSKEWRRHSKRYEGPTLKYSFLKRLMLFANNISHAIICGVKPCKLC